MLLRGFVSAVTLLAASTVFAQESEAPNAHERIRQSLLYIVGTGATEQGIPIETEGSGVVVTSEGLALTTFHTLAPLAGASNRPELTARLSLKTGPEFSFETTTSLPDRDVQFIKLVGAAPFEPAPCFSSEPLKPGDVVLTSGFPANDYYRSGQGTVETTNGPRGTLVALLSASKSQSGSPVYDLAGRVVDLLKGSLDGSEIRAVIVPTADFAHLLPKSAFSCSDKNVYSCEYEMREAEIFSKIINEAYNRYSDIYFSGANACVDSLVDLENFMAHAQSEIERWRKV